jgi:chromate reductase, NAD(P)H dehydrogenase (quinone)
VGSTTKFNKEVLMSKAKEVIVLVGSFRKASLSRKIAEALIALAPDELNCRIVQIDDVPLFNEDLESATPPAWTRLRNDVTKCTAVLFVTPEYNRSFPGGLKNALDVASRPEGKNAWAKKPTAVVSVTPYKMGAFGANHALRQTFVFLDMPAMQQPEAYIGDATKLFDDDGKLVNDATRKFLTDFIHAFARWVAATSKH